MYKVTKAQWNRLKREHPDYVGRALITHEHDGKVCRRGEAMCLEYLLPGCPLNGKTATSLVFEHIHFEIV